MTFVKADDVMDDATADTGDDESDDVMDNADVQTKTSFAPWISATRYTNNGLSDYTPVEDSIVRVRQQCRHPL